jgi:predicted PurR-regulated permease PerM
MFYEKIVHAMPTFRDKRQAITIGYDIEQKLSRYLLTVTLINAGLGTSIGLAMALIGMPNPLLFGVLGFVLNYIPYLGLLCGAGFATIVGFITFDHAAYALVPGAVYIGLNAIEAQFVTPYLVGRRLEMNPVVVFLSIALWAWLWSIVGMLVAVPLLVAIRTFCDHVPRLHGVRDFLSSRGSEMRNDDSRSAEASAAR